MYEYLSQKRIIPTWYIDDETLDILRLRIDVDFLLKILGLHYLVQCDFPGNANLTLEFLCTLEVNLFKVSDEFADEGTKLRTTGTLSFQMHTFDFEIPVETLGDILHLPTGGEGDIPKSFSTNEFGAKIVIVTKASRIQNLVFRYIHKVLDHAMFSREDKTRSTTLREIYLLHALVNGYSVNVVVVLSKQLSHIAYSPTMDIMIEGIVTLITEHIGISFCEEIELPIVGRSRWDMEYLMNMGIVYRDSESYGLVLHGKPMFYLPSQNKTIIGVERNRLYNFDNPSEEELKEEGFPNFETNNAGGTMDNEVDAQIPLPIKKLVHQPSIRINRDVCILR